MRAVRTKRRGVSLELMAALLCAVTLQALLPTPAQAQAASGGGHGRSDPRGAGDRHVSAYGLPREDASPGTQSDPSNQPSPGESPTGEPSPTAGEPSPPPGGPSPTAGPPTPASPAPHGEVGVSVSAGNAVLTDEYWKGKTTTSLQLTATDTGTVAETVAVQLSYPLPAGIQAATCPSACTLDLRPGETRSLRISLRVAPDAWKLAPLGGSLLFTATAPGATTKSGTTAWGVVFPPGPPTPGLKLQVFDVQLGHQATVPATLKAQLTNTGKVTAGGTVTVMAPAGVSFGALPAGCHKRGTVAECTVTTVDAGRSWAVQVPLAVPDRLRAEAPLVGLVRAVLRPSGQSALQTQASYQIFAPAGQTGVTVGTSAPADGSAPPGGLNLHDRAARFPLMRPAVVWPIISGSLVLLAVVLVGLVMTLRGRREEVGAGARPAGAGPVAVEAPEQPQRPDLTAVISAGPVDRTPTPSGPISWEWTTGEEPTQAPPADAEPETAGT
jgi:hypothetical protein